MTDNSISWEVDIPLITNPNMVGAWLKAMGATYLLCMLFMVPVFIGTGEAGQLPSVAGIFALTVIGLTLFGLLIMLLVFGNRFRARFSVSEQGIAYQGIDTRARGLARLAVVAGSFGGSARTTGAGLLALSQESITLDWKGAFSARYQPRRHTIVLRNQWRDLMHLYCNAENYDTVRAMVAHKIAQQGTAKRIGDRPSPLPAAFVATFLVVAACLPLFALSDLTKLDLLVSILIMAFSLATVWLIPLFGWVVLPLIAYVLFHLVVTLVGLREVTLVSTYSYRKYEALDSSEWAIVLCGLAGLAYLGWICWRAVRGHLIPVLMQDKQNNR